MSNAGNNVDWTQLREFASVDLAKSFVLSWHRESDALIIDIDVYLTPDHPFYEEPRPAERACIRPAYIEFPHCDSVQSSGSGDIGSLAPGAIAGLFVTDGVYEMSGEFGTVVIDAERPILRLKNT